MYIIKNNKIKVKLIFSIMGLLSFKLSTFWSMYSVVSEFLRNYQAAPVI